MNICMKAPARTRRQRGISPQRADFGLDDGFMYVALALKQTRMGIQEMYLAAQHNPVASERACPRSSRNILTDGAAALTLHEDFGDPNSYGFKVMTGPVSDPCISTAAGAAGCTRRAGSRL